MKKLNYKTLEEINYQGYILKDAKERIIQFGEGNFLRAFVDCFIDEMNEKANFNSKVVVVQPIENQFLHETINKQEGLYTLYLRGYQEGQQVSKKRVISCISRCLDPKEEYDEILNCADNPDLRFVISNTTEAGIVYDSSCKLEDNFASSFPGKLTQFLYRRFQTFKQGFGMVILSCELIDNNGNELKRCVLEYAKQWKLEPAFIDWIHKENIFCSTLVDRIVTGYPRSEVDALNKEQGYQDDLIDTAEIFGFWAIEGPSVLANELPFKEANCPVIITDNQTPYKQRKVRILNGAHTSFVLGAYLSGQDIVVDCMNDPVIQEFMNNTIYKEIIPTLSLNEEELNTFAKSVYERFKNPFIKHKLLDISLNSTSKWKARVLPSLKKYIDINNDLPPHICASFAFYLAFYKGYRYENSTLWGKRKQDDYPIRDDEKVLQFFLNHRDDTLENYIEAVCKNEELWQEDLTEIPNFKQQVLLYLKIIINKGAYELMKYVNHKE